MFQYEDWSAFYRYKKEVISFWNDEMMDLCFIKLVSLLEIIVSF